MCDVSDGVCVCGFVCECVWDVCVMCCVFECDEKFIYKMCWCDVCDGDDGDDDVCGDGDGCVWM